MYNRNTAKSTNHTTARTRKHDADTFNMVPRSLKVKLKHWFILQIANFYLFFMKHLHLKIRSNTLSNKHQVWQHAFITDLHTALEHAVLYYQTDWLPSHNFPSATLFLLNLIFANHHWASSKHWLPPNVQALLGHQIGENSSWHGSHERPRLQWIWTFYHEMISQLPLVLCSDSNTPMLPASCTTSVILYSSCKTQQNY